MSFINISERAYKYIRQFTIKNLNDALVELITNSIDAYNRTNFIERKIEIIFNGNMQFHVIDNAVGLTAEELAQCFLQVGNYTASDASRGFFSRGAKDISALGNVTFDSIKNGKYSQCVLDTDAYGNVTVSNIDVTDEIRNRIGINGSNNGLNVTLDILPNFQSFDISAMHNSLCKLGVLRDINTDIRNIITLKQYDASNNLIFEQIIRYQYPAATLLLDMEYTIPDYPDETARFVVYKSDKPIAQPIEESGLEFGFLIKDATTVYEVNTVDSKYRWNPYINYLYGYIKSDSIKKYLLDFDINGASFKNPYPIIDPSRLTGVNKLHPLIRGIYSIPLVRVDAILRELNNSVSAKTVTIEDISDLLDELSKYGLDIVQTNDVQVTFAPTYDGNLIKAIQHDRANYVTYEKSYIINGDYHVQNILTDDYILDEIIKYPSAANNYYYVNSKNELTQVQNISLNQVNDKNINLLELLDDETVISLKVNPYIYKLSESGTLEKLYIFQKGVIEKNSDDANVIIKNRVLSIQFINDLNIPERYIIDNTNGIMIKLNLNNPMVAKYLTNRNVDTLDDLINIESLKTTSSLMFMETLITDIFADLILQSDVNNKKIILDGDSYDNSKKILDYRNKLITKIETSVETIFNRYKINVLNKKLDIINNQITNIGQSITNIISSGSTDSSNLQLFGEQMRAVVKTVVE